MNFNFLEVEVTVIRLPLGTTSDGVLWDYTIGKKCNA
jgi:hypothetical protein